MSSVEESVHSGWDRTFLDISSQINEPFCEIWKLARYRLIAPLDPEKFDHCTSKVHEIGIRSIIALGICSIAFLAYSFPLPVIGGMLALATISRVCRLVGFALQNDGYTHVRGEAPENEWNGLDLQLKLMNWNVCGIGGGLSYDHGGVIHWRSRLDSILQKIKCENPDVLVLEEIYDTALAEALVEKLKRDYAHFYMHLGPNLMGSVGGCMVISKCVTHCFSHTSFRNNDWTLNRGFASLEIKKSSKESSACARIIGTHLIHGDQRIDEIKRKEQVEQMFEDLRGKVPLPTVLSGDLNIERDQEEGNLISSYLHHGYLGSEPTCTNHLTAQWDLNPRSVYDETIDYISLIKPSSTDGSPILGVAQDGSLENCHLVRAFDYSYNSKTALSDHHGLAATLILSSMHRD